MKKGSIIILTVLTILFTGCSSTKDTEIDNSEGVENTMPSELELLDNEMLDLDKYTLENNSSDYVQSSYSWNFMTRGDSGYYKLIDRNMRMWDFETQTLVTVCNKPNCKHDDDACAANGFLATDQLALDMDNLVYYKGYVYFIGRNSETEYASLYRVAGDGSTREDYMPLFRYDSKAGHFRSPYFLISKETVYYVDNNEAQSCIRKCGLGKGEQTVVFATGCEGGLIYRMKVYGDFLFFQAGTIDEEGEVEAGLYAYNMRSGEVKLVLKNIIAEYAIVDTKIIFSYNADIYSYDLHTAECINVIKGKSGPSFMNNSRYLVMENLEVYSIAGEYICKLALEDFDDILGIDEDYIIAQKIPSYGDTDRTVKLLMKPISELDDKPFEEYICEDE